MMGAYLGFYITLEATDPATGSVFSFQTLLSDIGRRSSLGVRISWVTLASRIKPIRKNIIYILPLYELRLCSWVCLYRIFLALSFEMSQDYRSVYGYLCFKRVFRGPNCFFVTSGNEPLDEYWCKDTPAIHEHYKGPLPKWFPPDEALACDSKKYYVVIRLDDDHSWCFF